LGSALPLPLPDSAPTAALYTSGTKLLHLLLLLNHPLLYVTFLTILLLLLLWKTLLCTMLLMLLFCTTILYVTMLPLLLFYTSLFYIIHVTMLLLLLCSIPFYTIFVTKLPLG
jgi:hypothetical protein